MDRQALIAELKQIIVDECDVDFDVDEIGDDALLLGSDSDLELDSLDALTISLEVKDRFQVHIDGGGETRMALKSVATLADFILVNE